MQYKGFTREFVNLIDGYKIDKIKKLINGDTGSKNAIKKKGVKGIVSDILGLSNPKELDDYYKNIFLKINLSSLNFAIHQIILEENTIFKNQTLADQWKQKLVYYGNGWREEQAKEDYKAQSLKNKVAKDLKKSLADFKIDADQLEEVIKKIKDRAFDQIWLCLDIEDFLNTIKQTLTAEQITTLEDHKHIWINDLVEISNKYDYANWLDWASDNAKRVSLSTHIAKLTHSSISTATSSIYFDKKEKEPEYLTTASLLNKEIDVSQSAAYEPISKLLKLEFNNELLADHLKNGDLTCFTSFAKDKQQLSSWKDSFAQAFEENKVASHSLSKQIFYPLNIYGENQYHLISPLASSSLDQAIFYETQRTHPKSHHHKIAVEIITQKKGKKFHPGFYVTYPEIAILKVTANNPANVSPLNGNRGGKRYLLSCKPPQWHSSLKPPINQESLFYGEFNRRAWLSAQYLQSYLLELQAQKSNKRIRDNVKKSVHLIIDILFNYVVEIQNMTEQAGWSESAISLKSSHQLWLDPYRDDDSFQQSRKRGDWQNEVCNDFGHWLNQKLRHDKMSFEKIEAKSWANMLKKRLREFERDLETLQ